MKTKNVALLALASLGFTSLSCQKSPEEKPNFLFLVIEDSSPYLFPSYGNTDIETPNIDMLAQEGVVFTNAFANGPQCSPARSTLISGTHATTYGNDFHREGHLVPQQYFWPALLREAGYFTINAGKTDYNITNKMAKEYYPYAWDENGGSISGSKTNFSYNDSARGDKPFYAQFNNPTSHMSRMTTVTVEGREPTIVDPKGVKLPPHVPDLPDVRSDYALHLDAIVSTDKWVGLFIDDLKKRGLYDNTIIFFFSDHGGCLPRGKAFPYESGFKPALVIRAPKKWQHLLPAQPGTKSDRIVEFADFGPTLLSVAGVRAPDHMTGEPFMGKYAAEPKKYAHNFRANTEYHFDPSRSVNDGKFQYIRYFTPYKIHALRQSFQFAMPAQLAWDSLYYAGGCLPEHQQYYEPKPNEMLFDVSADPYEINNLAGKPEYAEKLKEMREEAFRFMTESRDIGFFPSDVRLSFNDLGQDMYTWTRENNYDFDALHNLVIKASNANVEDLDLFTHNLSHERPEMRFWAASGIAYLAQQKAITKIPPELKQALNDEFGSVAAVAAEAMVYAGESSTGLNALLKQIKKGSGEAISSLEELRELGSPIAKDLLAFHKSGKKGSNNFGIRSILINFNMLPFDQLFTEDAKENFMENHRKRVREWAPTRP